MTEKKADEPQALNAEKTAGTERRAGNTSAVPVSTESGPVTPALPSQTGPPEGGPIRVDVTGIMPEGIRIDPDITEGHPGYEESGNSEIIPLERLARGKDAQGDDKSA